MFCIEEIVGPRDPRFARQSDHRGRRASWTAAWAAGGGAVGRVDRRARGAGAARRRQGATAARACSKAVENVIDEIAPGAARHGRARPGARRPRDARPRRHAEQGQAWAPTPSWASRWRSARAAAEASGLPLYKYLGGAGAPRAAGAADEHHQRRRARRQLARLPGVHDRPRRVRRTSPRRCAPAPRCSTR